LCTRNAYFGSNTNANYLWDSTLAGRSCVADVGNWAKEQVPRITTPIQYIFEDGDIGKGKLIERMNRDGYPTPDFRKKKDTIAPDGITLPAFTPLQAADFLAYEIFSSVKKTETTGSSDDLRWAMEEFIKTPIGHPGIYEVEDLARISNMSLGYRIFTDLRRLYSCGSQRAGDAPEVSTLWVRNKTSHFSSLSMPR
jgi:hypothetical protein